MTPEQKERIKNAAVELGAALTWVGVDFDIEIRQIACTTIESAEPTYGYLVHVVKHDRGRIA